MRLAAAGGSWAGLYSVDGLIIEPVPTNTVRLRHKDSAGSNGMVFTATEVSTSVPIVTAGNELRFEASGLTVSTGTKDAKLTTDTTHLRSDTPITAPGLVSTGTLAVSTTSTFTGALTANGGATLNGLVTANDFISLPDAPTATSHATNKSYVDTQRDSRVAKTGDTMSGSLLVHQDAGTGGHCFRARAVSNNPYIDWMDWAGNQLGWIRGETAALTVWSKGDITLNSAGGQVRTVDAVYAAGGLRGFLNGPCLRLIGSASNVYQEWFPSGSSIDSPGTRSGWMGYNSSGHLQIVNEANTASMFLKAEYAVALCAGSASYPEVARFGSWGMMIGKSATGTEVEGHTLWMNGTHYTTCTSPNAANIYCNRISSVSGERWMYFGRNGTGWLGSIYMTGTTGTVYATTSDYRTKTIIGPITDATDRLMALKPWRVTWNGDSERGETDDFMAHEVAEIVPDAVIGEKDAVDEDGNEVHQQMGEARLMALTVAALQDTIRRVDAVERTLPQVLAA